MGEQRRVLQCTFCSISARDLFIFRSYSVQSLFEVCAFFSPFISLIFVTCSHAISLHGVFYDLYTLLKGMHAGQQFACGIQEEWR